MSLSGAAREGREILRVAAAELQAVTGEGSHSQSAADQAAASLKRSLGKTPDEETWCVLAGTIAAGLLARPEDPAVSVIVTIKFLEMLDRSWFG